MSFRMPRNKPNKGQAREYDPKTKSYIPRVNKYESGNFDHENSWMELHLKKIGYKKPKRKRKGDTRKQDK